DLAAMMGRKDKVVETVTKGVEFLFRKNKVTRLTGTGRLEAPNRVAIANDGASQTVEAGRVLIATGSEVATLPGIAIDETAILSSTGALALTKVPKHFVVIGGGYIGLEMGSVWRRLGAEVTVIEFLDRITPGMDGELSKFLQRTLTRQGFKFKLGAKV